MVSRMLEAESDVSSYVGAKFLRHEPFQSLTHPPKSSTSGIHFLMTLFGRYFQIRDDYQNLTSTEVCPILYPSSCSGDLQTSQYTKQKGFCEDLDEGKFSLPLIHCLNSGCDYLLLSNALQRRRTVGSMTAEAKKLVLGALEKAQSIAYTRTVLAEIYERIQTEIADVERHFGKENFLLRVLLERLRVD